jgi:putative oxidoreductase
MLKAAQEGDTMAETNQFLSTWAPRLLSVMRIMLAFMFMAHGSQKLFGFPVEPNAPPRPPLDLFMGLGAALEFFGGLLLLLGLFTRPVAFVLSGTMAVAYWMFHGTTAFWPVLNHGELAAVYCFVFLYLAAAGGGPWSLDAALRGRARQAA